MWTNALIAFIAGILIGWDILLIFDLIILLVLLWRDI